MMLSEFIIMKIVIDCSIEAYSCLFLARCWGLRLGHIVVHQWTSDQLLIAADLTVRANIVWAAKQLV